MKTKLRQFFSFFLLQHFLTIDVFTIVVSNLLQLCKFNIIYCPKAQTKREIYIYTNVMK